jgi:hypothetical protein
MKKDYGYNEDYKFIDIGNKNKDIFINKNEEIAQFIEQIIVGLGKTVCLPKHVDKEYAKIFLKAESIWATFTPHEAIPLKRVNNEAKQFILDGEIVGTVDNLAMKPERAICLQCRENFPYAEAVSGFKCWKCRSGY